MEIYTPEEAAKILKVSTCTMHEMCRTGKIPCSKVGRLYRITDEDIKNLLELTKVDTGRIPRRREPPL